MKLTAASASASVCRSAYNHLSPPPPPSEGASDGDRSDALATAATNQYQQQLARLSWKRREQGKGGGCAGLRRRCHAVLKRQRTRLYILRRCVTMLLCWHEHDLSD